MTIRRTVVLPMALSALLSGCSFAFVQPPPRKLERLSSFECTDAALTPVLDTALAATGGVATAGALAAGGESTLRIVGAIAAAVLFTGSAWYGYTEVGRCREVKEDPRRWYVRDPKQDPRLWYLRP